MPPKKFSSRRVPSIVYLTAGHDSAFQFLQGADSTDSATGPKVKKFSMVAYTGGPIQQFWLDAPVVLDLAGLDVGNSARPILRDHDSSQIVGHSTSIDNGGKRLKLAGEISGTGPAAAEVVGNAANGFPWQASIGARVLQMQFISDNEKLNVNGRAFAGPLYVARKSRLQEVSFVALGADDRTSAKIAATAAQAPKIQVHTMNFEQWLAAKGLTIDGLSEANIAALRAMFTADIEASDDNSSSDGDGNPAPAGVPGAAGRRIAASAVSRDAQRSAGTNSASGTTPGSTITAGPEDDDDEDDDVDPPLAVARRIRAAAAAEETRINEVRRICGEYEQPALVAQAIQEGWDVQRTELQAMRNSRPRGPGIHSHGRERDCTPDALIAAMLVRANLNPVTQRVRYVEGSYIPFAAGDRPRLEQAAEMGYRYRDLSMIDLCRAAIQLDGRQVPTGRSELIRASLSGGTLNNIFTTTVGAQLLASYMAAPDTTAWCREAEVPNFQTNERHLLGKAGALKKHPRGGKASHATRDAVKEEYKIARYSNQFMVDEQDFIDDAFGALLTMPEEMGEAARQLRPDLVYAILFANAALGADSIALFDASTHNNLNTTAALAAATLQAAITDMSTQTQNGRCLDLIPAALLVPRGLKHTASALINSATLLAKGSTDATQVPTANPIQDDNLEMISDPRLDNGVTDPSTEQVYSGSATTWYLVARNARHTIEVGYLRGTGRAPQLRTFLLDRGEWGMGWDINLDIGAKALDYRGLHKNTA